MLGTFTDQSEAARRRLGSWLAFGAAGDLMVIEQRGCTIRGEMLVETANASPLDEPASVKVDARAMQALALRAIAHNSDKDLSSYTIQAFADDVDDLRRALGYDKISLFGGSFGSQWSLAVIRFHPDIVARAVLSCVEPLNNGFDMPSHVFAALQRVAFDADRDPGLAPWMPEGGMMEAVRALHRRFAAGPIRVTVRSDTGKAQTVVLGAEDLQLALLAHTDEAEHWPASILSLYHGHYDKWARQTLEDRRASPVKLIGPLADSSLGVTAEREHLMRTDPAVDLLGPWNFRGEPGVGARLADAGHGRCDPAPARDANPDRLRSWRPGHPYPDRERARPVAVFSRRARDPRAPRGARRRCLLAARKSRRQTGHLRFPAHRRDQRPSYRSHAGRAKVRGAQLRSAGSAGALIAA